MGRPRIGDEVGVSEAKTALKRVTLAETPELHRFPGEKCRVRPRTRARSGHLKACQWRINASDYAHDVRNAIHLAQRTKVWAPVTERMVDLAKTRRIRDEYERAVVCDGRGQVLLMNVLEIRWPARAARTSHPWVVGRVLGGNGATKRRVLAVPASRVLRGGIDARRILEALKHKIRPDTP
jgi:hypothetical protein